jgi:hypothetical protein
MSEKNPVAPPNPMDGVKIEVSPLFKNPAAVFSEDIRGERAENARHVERLRRAAETTPNAREERERIRTEKEKLERGYYRRTPGGARVFLGQFAPIPASEEEK